MQKQIQSILSQEMNRREFLGYIGAAFLAVVGVSNIVRALMNHQTKTVTYRQTVSSGYGSSPYGGLVKGR